MNTFALALLSCSLISTRLYDENEKCHLIRIVAMEPIQLDVSFLLKIITIVQCCHKPRARPEAITPTPTLPPFPVGLHSNRLKWINFIIIEFIRRFYSNIRVWLCDGRWWLLSNINSINTKLTKERKINPTGCDTSNNSSKANSSRNIFIGFEFDLFPFKLEFEYRVHGNRPNNYTNTDHRRE